MEIILLERVAKLGQMGEVVNVKEGYARNFLLPQGKALRANASNLARFEAEKAQMEARNLESKKEAEALSEKLDGQQFVVVAQLQMLARFTALSPHVTQQKLQPLKALAWTSARLSFRAPLKSLACMTSSYACTQKSTPQLH